MVGLSFSSKGAALREPWFCNMMDMEIGGRVPGRATTATSFSGTRNDAIARPAWNAQKCG